MLISELVLLLGRTEIGGVERRTKATAKTNVEHATLHRKVMRRENSHLVVNHVMSRGTRTTRMHRIKMQNRWTTCTLLSWPWFTTFLQTRIFGMSNSGSLGVGCPFCDSISSITALKETQNTTGLASYFLHSPALVFRRMGQSSLCVDSQCQYQRFEAKGEDYLEVLQRDNVDSTSLLIPFPAHCTRLKNFNLLTLVRSASMMH